MMLTSQSTRRRNPTPLIDLPMYSIAVVLVLMATSAAAAAVVGHQPSALESDSASSDLIQSRTRRDLEKRPRMAAWGKREPAIDGLAGDSPVPGEFMPLDEEEMEAAGRDKRPGRMAAWGKKSVDGGAARFAADKATRSKWSSGSMSVWGKRSASGIDVLEDYDEEKRGKWDDGGLAVWGKRDSDKRLASWGKRDSDKRLASWGKRDSDKRLASWG